MKNNAFKLCIFLLALIFSLSSCSAEEEQGSRFHVHNTGGWVEAVAPSCNTEGTLGHFTCLDCGKHLDRYGRELHTLTVPVTDEHSYGDWHEISVPNCTSSGERMRTCTACGKEHFERLPPRHKLGEWIDKIPPTCTSFGTLGHYKCGVCGVNVDAGGAVINDLSIAAKGHLMGEWVTVDSDTDEMRRYCLNCIYYESAPKNP